MLRHISSENSIAESTASSVHFDESITETIDTWIGKRGQKNKLKSLQLKRERVRRNKLKSLHRIRDENQQNSCFSKWFRKKVQ